jgi:hypothetical protein
LSLEFLKALINPKSGYQQDSSDKEFVRNGEEERVTEFHWISRGIYASNVSGRVHGANVPSALADRAAGAQGEPLIGRLEVQPRSGREESAAV